MVKRSTPIKVSSHVSRDFLQNAAYFNTIPKIIWEYISNSLDNAKEGIPVDVAVSVTNDRIEISDNGSGMSRDELKHFFTMHGENIQRKRGKRVRGRFGTGKSAAFGLANQLVIDTVQDGLRNVVELHREDIDAAKGGEPFEVREIIIDEIVNEDDGTRVEIEDLNVRRVDPEKVVDFIERHLGRYKQRARVIINGHECKFEEPQYRELFERIAPPDVQEHIGDVALYIKVSPVPLETENNGVDILSYGIWHETTLVGIETREKSEFLFGEIDVPILEDGDWPIPAFDNTRNNTLNRQNPVVVVMLGWIAEELENVRQILVEKDRERRRTQQAKELEEEARRLADIINDDFTQLELELEIARRVSRRTGIQPSDDVLGSDGDLFPGDGSEDTPWQQAGQPHGDGHRGQNPVGPGDTPRSGPSAIPGSEPGSRQQTEPGSQKKRQAIFTIEYVNETIQANRSHYDPKTKTIYINLDHPQIAGAFKAGGNRTDSKQFRDICYEVAAVEYALAVLSEKLERDEWYSADDALFDVRVIINRVTRRFAKIL